VRQKLIGDTVFPNSMLFFESLTHKRLVRKMIIQTLQHVKMAQSRHNLTKCNDIVASKEIFTDCENWRKSPGM
jgi:hypothetical protein